MSFVGAFRFGGKLSIMDSVNMGSSLPLRCGGQSGDSLLVCFIVRLVLLMSLLDYTQFEASLLSQMLAQVEAGVSLVGISRLDMPTLAPDFISMASSVASQCSS
jgi:hypothetical protein